MEDFIDSNPGLKSRFNRTIEFQDYNAQALTDIFYRQLQNNGFILDEEAQGFVPLLFDKVYLERDQNFGNAREVRKILDRAIVQQSNRLNEIYGTDQYEPSMINVITKSDLTDTN
jgi:hypothetical protein